MDRAHASKDMRELAVEVGYEPVVPSKKNFKEQWVAMIIHFLV